LSVSVAASALIVLAGTGAAATQPGRSAPAAITASLAAPAALDATGRATLVTQRGARNYAGPNCPGKGWNCTTSTRVLQIATNGGQNKVECTRPFTLTSAAQSCVIVQGPNNAHNSAKCNQRTNSSTAEQYCSIKQTGRRNTASIDQSVHASGSDGQSATQTAIVDQTSNGGDNRSDIDQSVKQSTSGGGDDEDDDDDDNGNGRPVIAQQTQDADQTATVVQEAAGSGKNSSRVFQSQRLTAKGAEEQLQNAGTDSSTDCAPDGGGNEPDSCTNIRQSSASGKNDSLLKQSIDEHAKTHVLGANQQQGELHGGIDAEVHQDTASGSSTNRVDQDKRQRLSAPENASQTQYDPVRCCGLDSQLGGTGNSERINQSSKQAASGQFALQLLELIGESRSPTGSCAISQHASNNSDSTPNSASQDPCPFLVLTTSCASGGGDNEGGGLCTPADPITTPPGCEYCDVTFVDPNG